MHFCLTVEWGPTGVGEDFLQQRARLVRGVREAEQLALELGLLTVPQLAQTSARPGRAG